MLSGCMVSLVYCVLYGVCCSEAYSVMEDEEEEQALAVLD
jgi:hypothetical protein